jgi:predicted RNA-binding protein YlqC (UPF0109 family)
MTSLIETIVKPLVDYPADVKVEEQEDERQVTYILTVHQEDVGKVIGKQGRTARSIRTILGAAGMKLNRRFTLEILE